MSLILPTLSQTAIFNIVSPVNEKVFPELDEQEGFVQSVVYTIIFPSSWVSSSQVTDKLSEKQEFESLLHVTHVGGIVSMFCISISQLFSFHSISEIYHVYNQFSRITRELWFIQFFSGYHAYGNKLSPTHSSSPDNEIIILPFVLFDILFLISQEGHCLSIFISIDLFSSLFPATSIE